MTNESDITSDQLWRWGGCLQICSRDFPFAALRNAKTHNPTETRVSFGGGAGVYKHVSGDFPIAALSGTSKNFNSLQNLSATKNFVLIQYNVHSLINFEERMQRVLQELEGRHWDAVAFLKPGDPSAMKLGKLDGDIRGLEVLEHEV